VTISREAAKLVGSRVRARRLQLEVPMERLALQSHMPVRLLNLLEYGLHSPTNEHLNAVAHNLGITAADLLKPVGR
jgi:transcriptional regulator with XRE-family HTH domain